MTRSDDESRSASALARSYRGERVLTSVIGLVALLVGVAALVVGAGWLGTYRAARPVLDPMAVDWLVRQALTARIAAILLGLAMLVLGLMWFFRSLRPEARPDLALDSTIGKGLTVTAGAISAAIAADAEQVDGVSRARVRAVGDREHPALRLSLWLRDGSDVKTIWREIDSTVLRRARESLGVEHLPTAVRLELGAAERQRVR
ncbi:hypothetical protein EV193_102615 [Herbihabitans rhizosphaerae]|uniref:Uncharacterized protein n=1 Tax=Herbihabitans rhizosphaerae TaxID=1872711 RepID=A0A4Q7L380_9PSEU|nr:alkaline shock response membrane anchor protein AmaP [Herbihabitans rhizosphaerae]RZS43634.1 hypothetical protein EV193_102615 [Herbihabitans rhizosphaerae]